MEALSDKELVERSRSGDTAAYSTLVHRYQRPVCAATTAVLGDFHTAQDAAQDAFLVAYERLGALRNPSAFGAWLLRIARREAIGYVRKRQREEALKKATPPDPRRNGKLDETSEALLAAVARLPEHEFQVVALHYLDGHSVQEVADHTERPVGTVTKQLQRARTRLRRILKRIDL